MSSYSHFSVLSCIPQMAFESAALQGRSTPLHSTIVFLWHSKSEGVLYNMYLLAVIERQCNVHEMLVDHDIGRYGCMSSIVP